jgi:hypothetical protein
MDVRFYSLVGRDPDTGALIEIALLDCLERIVRMRATFTSECGDEYRDLQVIESGSRKKEQRL